MRATDENVTVNEEQEEQVTENSFDVMVNKISEQFRKLMITKKGARDRTVNICNIKGVITTCFATGHLQRDEDYMNGYPLKDYKLDGRLKAFVMPRGVYIDESKLALNWLVPYPIDNDDILTPADFMSEQAAILGAMRLSDSLTSDLEAESSSLTLSNAAKRLEDDGFVHDDSEYFIPLRVTEACYVTQHYNFPVEDMIKLKMIKIFDGLK